eukprot:CAMPEP_0202717056 /NCGR_PEP_ID=MMETSP1385-20130828/107545_1 /ASSEMBLY_ACC=CAM_ASM_000861 /TAXON_ID=933848 /ORGANISM="Elphidium margaritaceum" /LENGTH=70 /DNA_ID=CAMNT_0049379093 /DNA_START=41 /DNA_END=250 /DNA_ORIENTATION=+
MNKDEFIGAVLQIVQSEARIYSKFGDQFDQIMAHCREVFDAQQLTMQKFLSLSKKEFLALCTQAHMLKGP